jgi:hypothetical protein
LTNRWGQQGPRPIPLAPSRASAPRSPLPAPRSTLPCPLSPRLLWLTLGHLRPATAGLRYQLVAAATYLRFASVLRGHPSVGRMPSAETPNHRTTETPQTPELEHGAGSVEPGARPNHRYTEPPQHRPPLPPLAPLRGHPSVCRMPSAEPPKHRTTETPNHRLPRPPTRHSPPATRHRRFAAPLPPASNHVMIPLLKHRKTELPTSDRHEHDENPLDPRSGAN